MENHGRLYWIDGLKGIYAIIVVAAHVYAAVSINLIEENTPLVHILWDGNFAVSAFIILSSMLTCYSLEKHISDPEKTHHTSSMKLIATFFIKKNRTYDL